MAPPEEVAIDLKLAGGDPLRPVAVIDVKFAELFESEVRVALASVDTKMYESLDRWHTGCVTCRVSEEVAINLKLAGGEQLQNYIKLSKTPEPELLNGTRSSTTIFLNLVKFFIV
jgi:hypothetical protein